MTLVIDSLRSRVNIKHRCTTHKNTHKHPRPHPHYTTHLQDECRASHVEEPHASEVASGPLLDHDDAVQHLLLQPLLEEVGMLLMHEHLEGLGGGGLRGGGLKEEG